MSQKSQVPILKYSPTKYIISLFPAVFTVLQLHVSFEPIDQFEWGLFLKVALQMV